MDTLIQLRQPQLSKKPDESALSGALTEALPPLAPELLADVAEALGQLEEDRRQLEEYQAPGQGRAALRAVLPRLRRHAEPTPGAAPCGRRRPISTTPAGRAARPRRICTLPKLKRPMPAIRTSRPRLRSPANAAGSDTLLADPTMQDANRLEGAEKEAAARARAAHEAQTGLVEITRRGQRASADTAKHIERVAQAERSLADSRSEAAGHASPAGLAAEHAASPLATLQASALAELPARAFDSAQVHGRALVERRREQVALLKKRHAEMGVGRGQAPAADGPARRKAGRCASCGRAARAIRRRRGTARPGLVRRLGAPLRRAAAAPGLGGSATRRAGRLGALAAR